MTDIEAKALLEVLSDLGKTTNALYALITIETDKDMAEEERSRVKVLEAIRNEVETARAKIAAALEARGLEIREKGQ